MEYDSYIVHKQEVRRNIILSMPPSNATVPDIVKHTADVSEAVRRSAFIVLAKKFPLQSLRLGITFPENSVVFLESIARELTSNYIS